MPQIIFPGILLELVEEEEAVDEAALEVEDDNEKSPEEEGLALKEDILGGDCCSTRAVPAAKKERNVVHFLNFSSSARCENKSSTEGGNPGGIQSSLQGSGR